MRHASFLITVFALALVTSIATADTPPAAGRAPARSTPSTRALAKPLTAAERVVVDRRLVGEQQVQAALARLAATSDGAARTAIQREIVGIKQRTELDVLAMLATQARARGDLAAAEAIDAQAAMIRQPVRPTGPVGAKPAVAPAARPSAEGGAR